jgi:hypothetical protein
MTPSPLVVREMTNLEDAARCAFGHFSLTLKSVVVSFRTFVYANFFNVFFARPDVVSFHVLILFCFSCL